MNKKLNVNQIKNLPNIIEYTNEYNRRWIGYTNDSPNTIAKQGYATIYSAHSIGTSSNSVSYRACLPQYYFLKETFCVRPNPKYKPISIQPRKEDRIFEDDIYDLDKREDRPIGPV